MPENRHSCSANQEIILKDGKWVWEMWCWSESWYEPINYCPFCGVYLYDLDGHF